MKRRESTAACEVPVVLCVGELAGVVQLVLLDLRRHGWRIVVAPWHAEESEPPNAVRLKGFHVEPWTPTEDATAFWTRRAGRYGVPALMLLDVCAGCEDVPDLAPCLHPETWHALTTLAARDMAAAGGGAICLLQSHDPSGCDLSLELVQQARASLEERVSGLQAEFRPRGVAVQVVRDHELTETLASLLGRAVGKPESRRRKQAQAGSRQIHLP